VFCLCYFLRCNYFLLSRHESVQVIVMRSDEAREKKIGSLEDLERMYPGLPEDMREFFRLYKVPVALV
jgi:hypothetical protein